MPAALDDGYVAIDDAGALVRVSADGKKTVVLLEGDYSRPVYSSRRGLVAVIGSGKLCVLDPQDVTSLACAAAPPGSTAPRGRRTAGRCSRSPTASSTRSSRSDSDATQWAAPSPSSRRRVLAAAWLANNRVAMLAGAKPHVRLLARRADGTFNRVRDFKALTGSELAATDHFLALRNGKSLNLIDVDRAQPQIRDLGTGVNPAWAK